MPLASLAKNPAKSFSHLLARHPLLILCPKPYDNAFAKAEGRYGSITLCNVPDWLHRLLEKSFEIHVT